MEAIGNFLAENNHYDVVSLQEVWTENDYQKIKKMAESVLPFAHYFYRWASSSKIMWTEPLQNNFNFTLQWRLRIRSVRAVEVSNCDDSVPCMVGERIRSPHSARWLVWRQRCRTLSNTGQWLPRQRLYRTCKKRFRPLILHNDNWLALVLLSFMRNTIERVTITMHIVWCRLSIQPNSFNRRAAIRFCKCWRVIWTLNLAIWHTGSHRYPAHA